MPSAASVNFGAALKSLNKAASANPEWFDIARDVLRRADNGHVLLLHALMEGLQDAYDRGRAGLPPPPLKLVESTTHIMTAKPQVAASPEPTAKRVVRKPAAPATPAPVKRIVRRP